MSVTSPIISRVTSPVVSRVTDGRRRRTTGPVLLTGDRYISPTGSDLADGLTRGTAWATFTKLNAWVNALEAGDHSAVVVAGAYTLSQGFYANRNTGINLTLDFDEGVTIDTSSAGTSGIAVENASTINVTVNLRGAAFVGSTVGSANGIGANNNVTLTINGAAASGTKASFTGYDDGFSCHGAAGTIVVSDCKFFNCVKAAIAHVDNSWATHNRCIFEGRNGALLGIGALHSVENLFNECQFVPVGNGNTLRSNRATFNKCFIGTPDLQSIISGWSGASPASEMHSTFNDCYVHVASRTLWMSGSVMDRCYGKVEIASQAGTTAFTIQHCIFNLLSTVRRLVDGLSRANLIDNVFRNSSQVIGNNFNASNIAEWNSNGSQIDHCNLFGTGVLAGIAETATNTQSTDPLIGPADTMNQADWAVQTGSPCISAGTAGGNIGFTLADIA